MRVCIIGTGNMAVGVATRALAGGHAVTFVGTHIGKAQDLADGMAGLGEVDASETVAGDVVVLAVRFTDAPHAVRGHAGEIGSAVLVDVTNPIDIGTMGPIDVSPFASGAQLIADVAPDPSRVVKGFNTTFAGTLVAGQVDGQRLDVFLAGDDEDAKATVSVLVTDGGSRPIDAGGLARARELEALALLHTAIQLPLGTGFASAVKIVPDTGR
jgi:predicted dinucleotide-binding enzyme